MIRISFLSHMVQLKFSYFGRKGKATASFLPLLIFVGSQVRNLGLILDDPVTYGAHISRLQELCHRTQSFLHHLTSKTWGANQISLLILHI